MKEINRGKATECGMVRLQRAGGKRSGKRKNSRKHHLAAAVVLSVILLTMVFLLPPWLSTANADTRRAKTVGYESVLIHKGDTLTAIAKERTDGSQGQIKAYIEETCRMNGINPDRITAGNYICVPIWEYQIP